MLEIISIEDITKRGQTHPLICKADNGETYFVKYAEGATINGLVKEWIAAHLALGFGFNVPEFEMAFLSQDVIDIYPRFSEIQGLLTPTEGTVFASKKIPFAEDFKHSNINSVFIDKQQDLLVFDLWVRNDDRNLTAIGGNVNLLWSVDKNDFYVIDHNLIFDEDLDENFLSMHVFRESAGNVYNFDFSLRQEYELKLQKILDKWDNYMSSCPKKWLQSDLFNLDLDGLKAKLTEDAAGALWDRLR